MAGALAATLYFEVFLTMEPHTAQQKKNQSLYPLLTP